MGFWSVLKKIGGVAKDAAPVINVAGAIFPPAGIAAGILNAIIKAEATITAPKSGALKSAMVKTDVLASLEAAREAAAALGKELVYDEPALQAAIDAQVLALNKMDAFKTSFKFRDAGMPDNATNASGQLTLINGTGPVTPTTIGG